MAAAVTSALHAAVGAALDAGLAVIPPKEDGRKRPRSEWKAFQTVAPTRGPGPQLVSHGGVEARAALPDRGPDRRRVGRTRDARSSRVARSAAAPGRPHGPSPRRPGSVHSWPGSRPATRKRRPVERIHWLYRVETPLVEHQGLARRPATRGARRGPDGQVQGPYRDPGHGRLRHHRPVERQGSSERRPLDADRRRLRVDRGIHGGRAGRAVRPVPDVRPDAGGAASAPGPDRPEIDPATATTNDRTSRPRPSPSRAERLDQGLLEGRDDYLRTTRQGGSRVFGHARLPGAPGV